MVWPEPEDPVLYCLEVRVGDIVTYSKPMTKDEVEAKARKYAEKAPTCRFLIAPWKP